MSTGYIDFPSTLRVKSAGECRQLGCQAPHLAGRFQFGILRGFENEGITSVLDTHRWLHARCCIITSGIDELYGVNLLQMEQGM